MVTNMRQALSDQQTKQRGETKLKIESIPSDEPQTSDETRLVDDLMQMGFPDKVEILDTIRGWSADDEGSRPTPDEIMFAILQQRENAEEAKKMDAARLRCEQHEQQRQVQIQKAETSEAKWIQAATTLQDLSQLFPKSWILEPFDVSATAGSSRNDNNGNTTINTTNTDA